MNVYVHYPAYRAGGRVIRFGLSVSFSVIILLVEVLAGLSLDRDSCLADPGFRPNFFFDAACWSSCSTAGFAFSQWCVSIRGVPSAYSPTCTLIHDRPTLSTILNGPSYVYCRGPSLCRFSLTCVTLSRFVGSFTGGSR